MDLADLRKTLHAAGIRLSADGAGIRAEPRGALTDEMRAAIKAHRAAILADLADTFEPYTAADLAEFDQLIRDDCARHGVDPEFYLAMRRRLAPARVMAELRGYREACR